MASQDGEKKTTAERLEDLEVRLAYMEHNLGELDKVVIKATEELMGLRSVVRSMQSVASEASGESQVTSMEEEVPPHY